jgi:hypothetical protein
MVRLPYTTALTTLFSYGLLFAFGQLRDFFRKFVDWFKAKNVKVRRAAGRPAGRIPPPRTRIREIPSQFFLVFLIQRLASYRATRRSAWAWRISMCDDCTCGSR